MTPLCGKSVKKIERKDQDDHLEQYTIFNNLLFYKPSKNISCNWKIMIPNTLIKDIILETHEKYGHFGINKIFNILKKIVYFRKMRQKITLYISTCCICQKTKFDRFTLAGLMQPILSNKPGELLSVDIYGPIPKTAYGHKYIFVVLDVFTKYTKFFPITKISGDKLSECILQKWIPLVGQPKKILSDNATYFKGSTWRVPLLQQGIQLIYTTLYNPSSNPVERIMQEIRRFMSVYCKNAHNKWNHYLNFLEFCVNSTTHTSTGLSPNELLFRRPDNTFLHQLIQFPPTDQPQEINYQRIAQQQLSKAALQRKKYHDKRIKPIQFQQGQQVLLRSHKLSDALSKITKKFHYLYEGPYIIENLFQNNTAELINPKNNKNMGIHNFRNLKPYKTCEN